MIHRFIFLKLLEGIVEKRKPDFIVGGKENPYLLRWFVIPYNRIFNIYLHCFKRSDDDRALHDHPWMNLSWLLSNSYTEYTNHGKQIVSEGEFRFRHSGRIAHRIELHAGVCWTLFITGPHYREWGFHCPRGWVHWRAFVEGTSSNGRGVETIGKGCDQ